MVTVKTNVLLTCGHVLYGVEINEKEVLEAGEPSWCPTCGEVRVVETETPWQEVVKEDEQ